MAASTPFPFLALPPEIRELIYQGLFTSYDIPLSGDPSFNILLANHTINREATKILYDKKYLEFSISWVNTPSTTLAEQKADLDASKIEFAGVMNAMLRVVGKYKRLERLDVKMYSQGEEVERGRVMDLLKVVEVVGAVERFWKERRGVVVRVFDGTGLRGVCGDGEGEGVLLEEYLRRLDRFQGRVVRGKEWER